MKHSLILITLLICFSSCMTKRKSQGELKTFDVVALSQSFIHSLTKSGVDTVLIYRRGCSGCIAGSRKTIYVNWMQDGWGKVETFDSYMGVRTVEIPYNLINYYLIHKGEIEKEVLAEPNYWISHYGYRKVELLLGDHTYSPEIIPDYYFETNDDKFLINWIYRIESELFDLERRRRTFY